MDVCVLNNRIFHSAPRWITNALDIMWSTGTDTRTHTVLTKKRPECSCWRAPLQSQLCLKHHQHCHYDWQDCKSWADASVPHPRHRRPCRRRRCCCCCPKIHVEIGKLEPHTKCRPINEWYCTRHMTERQSVIFINNPPLNFAIPIIFCRRDISTHWSHTPNEQKKTHSLVHIEMFVSQIFSF